MNDIHWNQRYASVDQLFSTRPDESLVELAGELPIGRALDLGAGEGRNSLWLAGLGWRVTAVDSSDIALGRLTKHAAERGLELSVIVADMVDYLKRGERFDLVVIANIHPEPAERATLFALAEAALTPGGHLFLVGHHVDALGKAGPKDPERLYTEDVLRVAFPDLQLLKLQRRDGVHGDHDEPVTDIVAWAVA